MREALHIFKKDARHLRVELWLSLGLMAVFVYAQLAGGLLRQNRAGIVALLLPGLWAFICARLIQSESIPGDRQFWTTRPYDWRSLLGAKLLFVVVFLTIPLLAADAVVLARERFSVAALVPGLLWSVMLVTAGSLVFCAFATLTRGLTQWMLSAIAVVAGILALGQLGNAPVWGGVEWMRDLGHNAILFLAALVVLLRQYRRRKTAVSIVVMAVGLLGSWIYATYLPVAAALTLETHFSTPKVDLSPIRISVHVPAERAVAHPLGREQRIALAMPIDVAGLQEGQEIVSDEMRIVITNESGGMWSREGNGYLEHVPSGYRFAPLVDRSVFEKAKGHPVHLHLTFYLTLVGNPVSKVIRPGDGPINIAGVGLCRFVVDEAFNAVVCQSPLRAPSKLLDMKVGKELWGQFFKGNSYSPLPADSSISPLNWYVHSGRPDFAPATLTSLEPLAHFRRDLDLPNIYLADFQVSTRF